MKFTHKKIEGEIAITFYNNCKLIIDSAINSKEKNTQIRYKDMPKGLSWSDLEDVYNILKNEYKYTRGCSISFGGNNGGSSVSIEYVLSETMKNIEKELKGCINREISTLFYNNCKVIIDSAIDKKKKSTEITFKDMPKGLSWSDLENVYNILKDEYAYTCGCSISFGGMNNGSGVSISYFPFE